jgi:hypothetical protein
MRYVFGSFCIEKGKRLRKNHYHCNMSPSSKASDFRYGKKYICDVLVLVLAIKYSEGLDECPSWIRSRRLLLRSIGFT